MTLPQCCKRGSSVLTRRNVHNVHLRPWPKPYGKTEKGAVGFQNVIKPNWTKKKPLKGEVRLADSQLSQ